MWVLELFGALMAFAVVAIAVIYGVMRFIDSRHHRSEGE